MGVQLSIHEARWNGGLVCSSRRFTSITDRMHGAWERQPGWWCQLHIKQQELSFNPCSCRKDNLWLVNTALLFYGYLSRKIQVMQSLYQSISVYLMNACWRSLVKIFIGRSLSAFVCFTPHCISTIPREQTHNTLIFVCKNSIYNDMIACIVTSYYYDWMNVHESVVYNMPCFVADPASVCTSCYRAIAE